MELEDVTFDTLREMTDGFSEKRIVGEGAFGVVYRGETKNGDDVAVKKMKRRHVNLDDKSFQNELSNLTNLKHHNIVQILGYCYETKKQPFIMPDWSRKTVDETHIALCFEYLHNGSLQKLLSDEFRIKELNWHTRFKIIKGTCEGLKYIHEELKNPIYHLDLKPGNILLDKDMVPKIADFGLSRIIGKEAKRTTPNPYGTCGYQPPEYINKGEISGKFDIFSLGVTMIRIVVSPKSYRESDVFIDQVRKDWSDRLQATCSGDFSLELQQVEACTRIALNCMQKDSQMRPDIAKITEDLTGIENDIGKLPKKWWSQKTVSRMAMHNNKIEMRMESMDITGQHQNINELEFVDGRETSSDVAKELIVGRTKEKGQLMVTLLESTSEKIVILPIYGIGGIGKTTFARLIYNDPNFKWYSQVWVDVSQRFDLKKICESIISQLARKENLGNERQMISCCLMELLPHKKILIVLDDLWEVNQFQLQELKDMLFHDDSNIIILVTTRSECVAERICTNIQPYKIPPLTNNMCWDIIKQKSGFEDRDDKEQLLDIGQEISKKCGGVALAAQSLGFTLRSKNFDQWMKVKNSHIWNNEPFSKDFSLPNHVLASLKLSYSYMSRHLKKCFTYCATFPKGHKILKDDLIYQWISLEYIKETKLHSKMQLSEKYVEQLLGLSFFQHSVAPKTYGGYYEHGTFFTMHDLVHDLAISILGGKIMDQRIHGGTSGSGCKYALLNDCSKPLELSITSPQMLRVLRFQDCRGTKLRDAAFKPAKFLHVLDLRECFIHMLPDSIGELNYLRYLNAPRIHMIPESITKLSNLMYLNFHGSSNIVALPQSIAQIKGLKHIDLSGCSGIEKLPQLFGNLKNLEHLDLTNCSRVTGVSQCLARLTKLKYLSLSCCKSIGKLSTALGSLKELQFLNLSDSTYLDQLPEVEFLASLTKLKYFNISSSAQKQYTRLPKGLGSLNELWYLNLSGYCCQEEFKKSFRNLRNLVHLDLSMCLYVKGVPEILSALSKLQYLNLSHCSEGLEGLENVLGCLNELRYLNLCCCLKGIFGDKSIDVTDNFLERIFTLSNLEYLNLSENDILYGIPETLAGLKKLHTLDVSSCKNLQSLPASLSEIVSLKFLEISGCGELDTSTLPEDKNNSILLPHFEFHTGDSESRSNFIQLGDKNPTILRISKLENVKSAEEAHRMKLVEKRRIEELELIWTKDAKRFWDDAEVLGELVPPETVQSFRLQGYNWVRFPVWVLNIAAYLPHLVKIIMVDLPNCDDLPPLGQLPNLKVLHIVRMDSIRKIDRHLYGGTRAFPQLNDFSLQGMKCLEEWNTAYTMGANGFIDIVFPNLQNLYIIQCPKLRFKPRPPQGNYAWWVSKSDEVILPSWGNREQVSASAATHLVVGRCVAPLRQGGLLRGLPFLKHLRIINCSDLTCSSSDLLRDLPSLQTLTVENCQSIVSLPERLGDLASLTKLEISNCKGIKGLPDSIQQLTRLQHLQISACPELVQWCKSEENKTKLVHIKELICA